jgi:kynurenine 3-monooxygenase
VNQASRGTAGGVIVVGAGPVGTLLAILLARSGCRVRVLERRADPRTDGAERGRSINLALAARGLLALERAGVLARVRPEMVEMRGRRLHDHAGNGPLLPYGQHEGEVIHAVSRARLNTVLIEAAAELPSVELRFGQRGVNVDPRLGVVQWRDEKSAAVQEVQGELVIGADGAGSALRHALHERGLLQAREAALAHDYKELHIPPTSAGGWALEAHALHVWPRGGYMLIALPNPDRSFTATLFLPARGTPGFDTLASPAQARAFFASEFPDALALIPDFEEQFRQHPQGQLATLYCWPWHVQRLLLIGDAAHAIVPFHGQGLNCGFEDCVLLADLLARHVDPEIACAQFERSRRPDTDAIATMAIENYQEMRASVLAPDFVSRKQLSLDLERRFPWRFIPRYSMVMFHAEIPYAEALRRGALQESILDALLAAGASAESTRAAQLLDEAGL